jgi:hypothetical protein
MFIVVDNVTFRMVDAPVTGYTVIRDEVAPSISYIKYYNLENEVEVGAEIDLSVIRVTDNKDMNPTLDITVTLNGEAVALTDGKFTATEAGTYVAKLVGRDASGNETTVELKFTAAAAQGGEGSTEGGCFGGIGMGSVLAFAAFAVAGLLKKRA